LAIMNDFPPGTVPGERIELLREQVAAARAAGIESIFVLQHYLGNMPTLQPIPLLAALASSAAGMTLGTNMFILPLRHPVAVAEEFATLDHLTGGHTVAGFGLGYRENEFESFGVGMAERVRRFDESVHIIRGLWRGAPTTYQGQYYSVTDQHISLVPVRAGGPPIWVGAGSHRAGAARAAALGDGWILAPHTAPDRARRLIDVYRDERARLGLAGPGELVLRRELVLDEDASRARAIGLAARNNLTRRYAEYNAPDATGTYRHLRAEADALDVADQAYLFTDPSTAVAKLRQVAALGIDHVLLRAQWYDLGQEQVLATLRLFGEHVRPALR
jgi:alkanesulfonate monooxygenase SsuD/methylene tetrahydromethanopterin reductase-like flavin-dependent oxidoreductase (luciferase family)